MIFWSTNNNYFPGLVFIENLEVGKFYFTKHHAMLKHLFFLKKIQFIASKNVAYSSWTL
jgi:hypothetical protein